MDRQERSVLKLHIMTFSRWLNNGGKVAVPTVPEMEAIEAAIDAMKSLANGWEDYQQPIAILNYHVTHPTELLFRDPVTIKVIKIAIDALERKAEGRR
ncbi:MAG: hypothetical protein IJ418_01710 [Clostridia bacterium]|nr:hypothetical protein [Clostridia bacterium]